MDHQDELSIQILSQVQIQNNSATFYFSNGRSSFNVEVRQNVHIIHFVKHKKFYQKGVLQILPSYIIGGDTTFWIKRHC